MADSQVKLQESPIIATDETSGVHTLKVKITGGAGSGGTSATDDAAFTVATDSGTPMMGVVTADSVNSGDVGVVGMLTNRQLKVTLYDSAGVELAVGGGTQYTEDAAAAANPVGNALMMVREDARAGSLVSADGDNVAARGTNSGELYVKHVDSIPVTDNSGSLTVDNAGTFAVQATVAAAAASIAKAEDAAHSTGEVGVFVLGVRADTAASTAGTDGDYAGLTLGSTGRLWTSTVVDTALPAGTNAIGKLASNSGVTIGAVEIAAAQTLATVTTVSTVTNVATIGTSVTPGTAAAHLGKAEDAAHTTGDTGVFALAVRSDTAAATGGTDGDYVALITNSAGKLWVDASGQTLTVGTVTTSVVPGTSATHLGKAEDAAHTTGDTGVFALSVRADSASSTAGADGDYAALITSSTGRLWTSTVVDTALPAGTNAIGKLAANSGVDIGDVDVASVTPGTAATSLGKAEDDAHTSGDVGVMALAVRKNTAASTSGADGDYQPLITDTEGACWTRDITSFTDTSTDITRPADTTAYAAGDVWADSTSTPTTGGFTLSSVVRGSGKSGILTDIVVSTSAASSALAGQIILFNQAVTAVNDNAALAISDAEAKTIVGIVAFDMANGYSMTNNTSVQVRNINMGFTCSGSANLRYLVRVNASYTPASAEVLTVRAKVIHVD